MDILNAIILGVVEGITEFLPISSTGHLILASRLLGITSSDFLKSFEIFIQSGAILAVIILYWRDIFTKFDLLKKVFIAFIPTAVIGLLLYKVLKEYLLGNTTITLLSLFLGGIALIIVELSFKKQNINERTVTQITYKNAFLVGLIQSISIIPGVSRSAASIIGGMLLGMDRKTAVEFSFLLAIPTLLAATGLDLIKTNFSFSTQEWTYLASGFLSSFIVAVLVIKWLVSYVKKYTFIPFGIYRIIIAIFLFGLFMI
ncbi:MAG: undecaprenyl-diphosphate phosphatase [Candidatus Levybacteria bacterium]|nr:undecaprenyl-diphosphate phosphatase [Candidatus Levybacteria bacterium]MBP9815237.1 undecaprenyl-diphosphate phosphatase [Candidatus Levybacteria bacterium]